MPSLGFLGAIGGAAQGFSKGIEMQIEEARAARIEELRSKNRQQENRENNQQRHTSEMARLDKSNEYSLAQMAQSDELTRKRTEDSRNTYTDGELFGVQGQYDRDNKFTPLRTGKAADDRVSRQFGEAWMEPVMDGDGQPVMDPTSGEPLMRQVGYQWLEDGRPMKERFDAGAPPKGQGQSQGSAPAAAIAALTPENAPAFKEKYGYLPEGFEAGDNGQPSPTPTPAPAQKPEDPQANNKPPAAADKKQPAYPWLDGRPPRPKNLPVTDMDMQDFQIILPALKALEAGDAEAAIQAIRAMKKS